MKSNEYHDTIKVEFRELLLDFIENKRKTFHCYTVHRVMSMGLLIGYTFKYVKSNSSGTEVRISLSLEDFGDVLFTINTEDSYGKIKDEESKEVIRNFLEGFDVSLKKETYRRKGKRRYFN